MAERHVAPCVVGLVAVVLAVVAVRRRWLLAEDGAVDVSFCRRPGRLGRGWTLGVARYTEDHLLWFRVFAVGLRPAHTLHRQTLTVVGERPTRAAESWAVQAGAVIVECRAGAELVQLAMSEAAVTGLRLWLRPSAAAGPVAPRYTPAASREPDAAAGVDGTGAGGPAPPAAGPPARTDR